MGRNSNSDQQTNLFHNCILEDQPFITRVKGELSHRQTHQPQTSSFKPALNCDHTECSKCSISNCKRISIQAQMMPAMPASHIEGPPSNVRVVGLSKPAAVSVAYSRHCQVWQVSHVHETPHVELCVLRNSSAYHFQVLHFCQLSANRQ